jgi:hypothetical protein
VISVLFVALATQGGTWESIIRAWRGVEQETLNVGRITKLALKLAQQAGGRAPLGVCVVAPRMAPFLRAGEETDVACVAQRGDHAGPPRPSQ